MLDELTIWRAYCRELRRRRVTVQRSFHGAWFGLIGTLAITQTAEIALGFPHLPVIAYGISGVFAVRTWFAVRYFRKLPKPRRPTFRRSDDGGPGPSPPDPAPPRPLPDFGLDRVWRSPAAHGHEREKIPELA